MAIVGDDIAARLSELTLEIYTKAEEIARGRGIILADTKVEFGIDAATGVITLGDEVLTPDSSRFWDAATYEPGKAQPSYDKQYVRDWLTSAESGWDKSSDTAAAGVAGRRRRPHPQPLRRGLRETHRPDVRLGFPGGPQLSCGRRGRA